MSDSLPPGVTSNMLPGNSSADMAYDQFYDDCSETLAKEYLEKESVLKELKEMLLDTILLEEGFSDFCNKRFIGDE